MFQQENPAAPPSGFDGAHQTCGACAEDEDIDFGHGIYCLR